MTEMEMVMDLVKKNIFSKFLPNEQAVESYNIYMIIKMLQA